MLFLRDRRASKLTNTENNLSALFWHLCILLNILNMTDCVILSFVQCGTCFDAHVFIQTLTLDLGKHSSVSSVPLHTVKSLLA